MNHHRLLLRHLLIPALLLSGPLAFGTAQAWQIGHRTVTWQDPTRSNRSVQTEVYYPADVAGENVPVGGDGTTRFPLVVFGHGFLMTVTAYQYLWEGLTPDGYIVALPRTEGSILPSHAQFALDLAFLADTLRAEGARPASFLYARVGATAAVAGHSMGGGASILAAADNPGVTAVANLAAAETNPSAIGAAPGVTAPALIFSGSLDCVTPPAQHQIPIYQALGSECRTHLTLTGASHCQFAESNFNCSLGEGSCPSPAITRDEQHARTLLFLRPWLDAWLKEDGTAWDDFQQLLAGQAGITFEQDCATATEVPELALGAGPATRLALTPNPFRPAASDAARVRLLLSAPAQVSIDVRSVDGRIRREITGLVGLTPGEHRWNWDGRDRQGRLLPAGVYFCLARVDGNVVRSQLVLLR